MGSKKFECSAVLNGVEIELTNYCGLDCFGCIRKESKEFGYLKYDTLKKIISLIINKNYTEIVFSGLGDVFLNKDLYKFIDYIFIKIPNIKIYIMTKGQSIKPSDIDKLLDYNRKGFNLGLTYSIFSLDKDTYRKITGGGSLEDLLRIIKISYEKKINFSFEFLLNKNNIKFINSFKKFCIIFKKDFFYSIPHNWGGNLNIKKYNKLFGTNELESFIKKRNAGEKCEAFTGKYLFFDYSGNIYKCGLKRFNNDLYIGNINENNFRFNLGRIDYNKCIDCSYFTHKTNI